MKLTVLQRSYLMVLAEQPEGWFTANEAARKHLRDQYPTGAPIVYVRREANHARRILHRLADLGLANRSPVGKPPGINELRFKARSAGLQALEEPE